MTLFSLVSSPDRRRPARLSAALAAAVIAALAAGCSASGSGGSSTSASGGGQATSALQAIKLAAADSRTINTMAMSLNEQFGTTTITGTIQLRRDPLLMRDNLAVTTNGTTIDMSAIIDTSAYYLRIPQLSGVTGKPWVKITLGQLSSKTGINLAQAFQQAQNMSPSSTTQIFTASQDIHKVGTATINGIPTTEYAGTVTAAGAISRLPVASRKQLASLLSSLGTSPVSFQVWIDGNNVVRKAVENLTVAGQHAVVTSTVTAVNQPISITIPPASQTGTIPGL